jgi:hypothetical protein
VYEIVNPSGGGRFNRAMSSLTDGSQGLESFLYVVDEPKLGGEDVPHDAVPIYYVSYSSGEETQGIGYPVQLSDLTSFIA